MAATFNEWFHRRGELSRDGWESVVDGSLPGWSHTGIRVTDLGGTARDLPAGDIERIVIPLSGGGCEVDHAGTTTRLTGRAGVFAAAWPEINTVATGVATGAATQGWAQAPAGTIEVDDVEEATHIGEPTRHD